MSRSEPNRAANTNVTHMARHMCDNQLLLAVPPVSIGGRKMYLTCIWDSSNTVALWGADDHAVRVSPERCKMQISVHTICTGLDM